MTRRDRSPDSQHQAILETSNGDRLLVRIRTHAPGLRRGLWRVPLPPRHESPALRTNHGYQLRRGGAEEWQDAVHLQSSRGANLRPWAVSARRLCALLVFATAYRAAHEHLNRNPAFGAGDLQ